VNLHVLPEADDDLALQPHVGPDESELPVAIGGLVQIHESVSMMDQGNSSLNCVCRCIKGLLKLLSPAIHTRAGEEEK
jgi:hypothetical protein